MFLPFDLLHCSSLFPVSICHKNVFFFNNLFPLTSIYIYLFIWHCILSHIRPLSVSKFFKVKLKLFVNIIPLISSRYYWVPNTRGVLSNRGCWKFFSVCNKQSYLIKGQGGKPFKVWKSVKLINRLVLISYWEEVRKFQQKNK